MKDLSSIRRDTMLPGCEEKDREHLLHLMNRLEPLEDNQDPFPAVSFPLREDEAHQFLSLAELQRYFPAMKEKGMELPGMLPHSEEKP